jgi:hypothetical protein
MVSVGLGTTARAFRRRQPWRSGDTIKFQWCGRWRGSGWRDAGLTQRRREDEQSK